MLKDGSRKNAIMNAIASQLSAADIADVAAFFASQAATTGAAKSELLPHLVKTGVSFPENYKSTFVKYYTINFPATRQVRYYYMNPAALQAAKEGKPLPNGSVLFAEVYSAKVDADKKPITGSDGFYVPDQLLFYTAMARDAGWGKDIPEMLRNEDWNYAVFTNAKQLRAGVNQAECLAATSRSTRRATPSRSSRSPQQPRQSRPVRATTTKRCGRMVVHVVDGTYELFRHFNGLRRFSQARIDPMVRS